LAAVTTTTAAPNVTTTSTTTPAAGSRAANPNQAANFAGSGNRASVTAAVDGKGTAYVLWMSGTANVTPAPPPARYLSTSTDGGKTWNTAQTMPFSYDNASPRMAVSPEGTIHIVYGRNP
jgi:Neuraminidase (sialidase)